MLLEYYYLFIIILSSFWKFSVFRGPKHCAPGKGKRTFVNFIFPMVIKLKGVKALMALPFTKKNGGFPYSFKFNSLCRRFYHWSIRRKRDTANLYTFLVDPIC